MNVLIGGYYRRNSGGAQYSPTFGRGGNAALFSVEILDCDASTSMTVVVEHKNEDETTWATLATLATMTSGVNMQTASAIKEQLRYAITINGASASLTVYANILAPVWRPY